MEDLDLSEFFQTKAQAHDFSLRLAAISEKIYETDFNLEKALMEQFGIRKKDAFISFLRNHNLNGESTSALKAMFSKIEEGISALPVISLTLAIEPTEEIIKDLSDWFILNMKKHVLFDIKIDPTLIAGTTMTYAGKYMDFSIKPVFDAVLKGDDLTKPVPKQSDLTFYKKYNATPLNGFQQVAQHA